MTYINTKLKTLQVKRKKWQNARIWKWKLRKHNITEKRKHRSEKHAYVQLGWVSAWNSEGITERRGIIEKITETETNTRMKRINWHLGSEQDFYVFAFQMKKMKDFNFSGISDHDIVPTYIREIDQ